MNCPICESSLIPTKVQVVDVDRCEHCGGIWFDEKELMPLLREEPRMLKPLLGHSDERGADLQRGNCPKDGAKMVRVYSARNERVVVDSCPECRGIWLDGGGEFDELLKS